MVTPSQPHPPLNNFCLYPPPVLRCFWKDPLMTPTTPLQASFTATPSSSTTHSPTPKNSDHTPSSSGFIFQTIREHHIAGQSLRKSTHKAIPIKYSVKLNLIHKNFICGQFYRSHINHRKLKCRESNSSIRFKTIKKKARMCSCKFSWCFVYRSL